MAELPYLKFCKSLLGLIEKHRTKKGLPNCRGRPWYSRFRYSFSPRTLRPQLLIEPPYGQLSEVLEVNRVILGTVEKRYVVEAGLRAGGAVR